MIQPVDLLLPKLDLVKQSSSGKWRAKCPIHQDRKSRSRTLVITETDSGSVLIYCHAGCNFEEILSTVGLDASDLFPTDNHIQHTKHTTKPQKNLRSIIERSRFAATLIEIGTRQVLRGEELSTDDLNTLAGAASDLQELLDV